MPVLGPVLGLGLACGLVVSAPAAAKVPGQVHCYGGVCHRVLSVAEVRRLVGRPSETLTSFYDVPERDRMNAGTVTSSGELFDAWSPQRAASSIYPDGTELLIWNPVNGRAAHIRVNDFGPFYSRRTLDVTRRVAEDLGFVRSGVATLKVVVVAAPSPEEARHQKGRSYSRAHGYIGRYSADDIDDLAADLIADAAEHRQEIQLATRTSSFPVTTVAEQTAAGEARTGDTSVIARSRLPWVHRVALARAETSLSATSELVLALALEAARASPRQPSPIDAGPAQPAVPDDGATTQSVAALAAPAAESVVALATPRDTASEAPPPAVVVAGATLPPPAAGRVTGDDAEATAPPASTALVAARSAGKPTGDASPAVMLLATVKSPEGIRWLIALLLAATLLLIGRLGRDRRPAASRSAIRPYGADAATGRGAGLPPVRHGSLAPSSGTTFARAPVVGSYPLAAPDLAAAAAHAPAAIAPALPEAAPPVARSSLPAQVVDVAEHARALLVAGRVREAEPLLWGVLAACERAYGDHAPELVRPLGDVGCALREQGRDHEALAVYGRALALCDAAHDADPRGLADLLESRALLLVRTRNPVAAAADAARAVALRGGMLTDAAAHDPDLGVALSILGEAHRQAGDIGAAESAHRRALAEFGAREGSSGLRTAGSMTSLAEVLVAAGRAGEARELLLAALPVLERHLGLRHPGVAQSRATLASVYQAHGDIEEAVRLRRQSLSILERFEGADHPDVAAARRHLAALIEAAPARRADTRAA